LSFGFPEDCALAMKHKGILCYVQFLFFHVNFLHTVASEIGIYLGEFHCRYELSKILMITDGIGFRESACQVRAVNCLCHFWSVSWRVWRKIKHFGLFNILTPEVKNWKFNLIMKHHNGSEVGSGDTSSRIQSRSLDGVECSTWCGDCLNHCFSFTLRWMSGSCLNPRKGKPSFLLLTLQFIYPSASQLPIHSTGSTEKCRNQCWIFRCQFRR